MDTPSQMRAFEEILDPLSLIRKVDLNFVRDVCSRGIPDQPPWIRPRIWKLLLGSLPPEKDRWATESRKARDRYYDLATEFLDEVERMPEPTYPLSPRDKLLDTIAKDVARTQPRVPFFRSLVEASPFCPLSPLPHGFVPQSEVDGEPVPQRIQSAPALYERLLMIQKSLGSSRQNRTPVPIGTASSDPQPLNIPKTPEIRLLPSLEGGEGDASKEAPPLPTDSLGLSLASSATPAPVPRSTTPTVSVTSPTSATFETESKEGVELLPSQPIPKSVPKHSQILLRILYLFSVTHQHQPYTQGLNELLAPLYYALCSDLDERESVHAEADAFWLFSELIGEVGAVVGEPGDWRSPGTNDVVIMAPGGAGAASNGVKGAMAEFSHRLRWADLQLWEDLTRKSLDPRLPYYSYRWIACLLAQDLPLSSALRIWDTILAQPPSLPDANPRISFLINICTSMLIRLRSRLIKTGNIAKQSGGLWDDEYIDADEVLAAKQGPLQGYDAEGVMGEGFVEGMVLLQAYPIQAIGVDMIIQGAWDLTSRMKYEEERRLRGPSAVAAVGSRLRDRIMNGITNRAALAAVEEDEGSSGSSEDEGDATEKERDGPPSVKSIEKAAARDTPTLPAANVIPSAAKLRQMAASLQDSDAAAQLSKASTNWRVAAIDAFKSNSVTSSSTATHLPNQPPKSRSESIDLPASSTESTSGGHSQQSQRSQQSNSTGPATTKLWQYAEAFKSSDTAASLSKVSSNWTAAALDRWNKQVLSSPLNPTAPPLPPPKDGAIDDAGRSRGGSLGSWTNWGTAKAGTLWGGSRGTSPLSPTAPQQDLSPTWTPAQQSSRDTRTSLPVPHRGRSPANSHHRSPSTSPAGYSPPKKPVHFANPRDSFGGFPQPGDILDPLELALAKVAKTRVETGGGGGESSPDDPASRLGGSIRSALATLSGAPVPPSPSVATPPKSAPRPLLLGTPAAKSVPTPSPKLASITLDSRPSSISSNASVTSSVPSTVNRTFTPTPRTSTTSARPESPATATQSDNNRRPTSGFVPLRNGVGRSNGSATLMRKSRAAHPRPPPSDEVIPDVPPLPISLMSPTFNKRVSDSPTTTSPTTPGLLVLEKTHVKKYSLTDAPPPPPPPPPAPAADGYSSGSSAGRPAVVRSRIRTKRMYQPKAHQALRVQTAHEPDELGLLNRREGGFDGKSLHPDAGTGGVSGASTPLTPQVFASEALRTPTSGDKDAGSRSPRSPRRLKKVPSREREGRPPSSALSEDGERADDEDGYGDLLSAYSEDDATGSRRSIAT